MKILLAVDGSLCRATRRLPKEPPFAPRPKGSPSGVSLRRPPPRAPNSRDLAFLSSRLTTPPGREKRRNRRKAA